MKKDVFPQIYELRAVKYSNLFKFSIRTKG